MRIVFPPFCFFIFLMLASSTTFSQDGDFIKGQLIDAKTQEPIAFATIQLKGYALGVISNEDGGFRVSQNFGRRNGVLKISSMGYATKEVQISNLSEEVVNIIALDPGIIDLKEAVVQGKIKHRPSAIKIVQRAIRKIPTNFPENHFSLVGYYRDYQVKDQEYVNLNEALLEIYDKGFREMDQTTTKVRLYEYRENTDFPRDTLAALPYDYKSGLKVINKAYLYNFGGNELAILRVHDAIRNYNIGSYSFVNRLDTDLIKNHDFYKAGDVSFDGENLYQIKFNNNFQDFTAFGTLYIAKDNYAIYKLEYSIYDRKRRSLNRKSDDNGTNKQLIFKVSSEYHPIKGKMYPNYISLHNSFQVQKPSKFKIEDMTLDLPRGCFVIKFNEQLDIGMARQTRYFHVIYKNKKLKLKKTVVENMEVLLYPDMDKKESASMFSELAKSLTRGSDFKKILSFEVDNIRDVNGNRLQEFFPEDFNQFREYFVQEVKLDKEVPTYGKYMNMDRPIDKDQPLFPPSNFTDYWMNTPLKKSE